MRFKKIKYNVVCILLVMFVLAAVLVQVCFVGDAVDADSPNNEIVTPSNGEDKDDPDINNNPNESTDNSSNDTNNNDFDPNIPPVKYTAKMLDYCINKMATAESYKTNINFTSKFDAAGLGMDATQTIYGFSAKLGNERLEDITYKADNLASVYADYNYISSTYRNGNKTYKWQTDKNVFDKSQLKYIGEVDEGAFIYDLVQGSPKFSKTSAQVSWSTQMNKKTGKTCYLVTVSLVDVNKYPNRFLRQYNDFCGGINFESVTQTVEFTIDQASGWILSLTKKESFKGKPKSFGAVNVDIKISYTQTFEQINSVKSLDHLPLPN